MKYLKIYLNFIKENKNIILIVKLFVLFIINVWLLIIFWKILLMPDNFIINNNVVLTKISVVLKPLLNILGLDVLTPNIFKMLIITIFIIISNLLVLYFSQMAVIIIMTIIARYSYKSYSNYLIDKDNLNYIGFKVNKVQPEAESIIVNEEILEEIINKVQPEAEPIIVNEVIEKTVETVNSTNWGIWIVLGAGLLLVIGYIIYSQNSQNGQSIATTNENVVNLAENSKILNKTLNERMTLNERLTRNLYQMNSDNNYIIKSMYSELDGQINLINTKLNNVDLKLIHVEATVKSMNVDLIRIEELSKQSLLLSQQANKAINEIAVATSAVEFTSLAVANIWSIVQNSTLTSTTTTTPIITPDDSITTTPTITTATTPRNSTINPLKLMRKQFTINPQKLLKKQDKFNDDI